MEQQSPRSALAAMDLNAQAARRKAAEEDASKATAAVYELREAQLKAQYKHQLRELLAQVSEEQESHSRLQAQHSELSRRYDALASEATTLRVERKSLQAQLDQSQAQNQQLFQALQDAETIAREKGQLADTAQAVVESETRRRKEESSGAALREQGLVAAQRQALDENQRLLGQLAVKDTKIASLGEELLAAQAAARSAQSDAARLDALCRQLGERLAGSEAQVASRTEAASQLHRELAELRDRHLSELSELKAARVEASEAVRLREQLTATQSTVSVLVEAREELRTAVTQLSMRLAAEQERVRRMESLTGVRDTVVQLLEGLSPPVTAKGTTSTCVTSDITSASWDEEGVLASLSGELDAALRDASEAGARAAALDAACAQHEAHIRKLSSELSDKQRDTQRITDHNHTLQRMVAELQAEMQRLSSQAACGPPLILDLSTGQRVRAQQPQQPQQPSTTQPHEQHTVCTPHNTQGVNTDGSNSNNGGPSVKELASVLETCCTATRVAITDKGFAAKALAKRLVTQAAGMPLDGLTAQQRVVQASVSDLVSQLDSLSVCLSARPLDAPVVMESLPHTCERVRTLVGELTQARDALLHAQSDLIGCESRLCQVESSLTQCDTLLSGWVSLCARTAAEGSVLDDTLRTQLKTELQAAEQTLSRSVSHISASAASQSVSAGDAGVAGCEVSARTVQTTLLDLAARLPERDLLSDAKLKASVVSTQVTVHEQLRAVSRTRLAVASGPQACAALAGEVSGVVTDIQTLLGQLEELTETVKRYMEAGRNVPVDPVALQGEVLALKAQLRASERTISELETTKGMIRSTTEHTSIRSVVSSEALEASERARASLHEEVTRLHAALVQQRLRHSRARLAFVAYYACVREGALLRACVAHWRAAVADAKVAKSRYTLASLTADNTRLSEAAERRRVMMLPVLLRLMSETDEARAKCAIRAWKLYVHAQAACAHRWARLIEKSLQLVSRAQGAYPTHTIAQRLAGRTLALRDPWSPPLAPRSDTQLVGLVLAAWRSWARNKKRARQVASLSAGMPALVSAVGARRRKERAWLGWRLAVVDELVGRANVMLLRAGQRGVGRHTRVSSAGGNGNGGVSSGGGVSEHLMSVGDALPAPSHVSHEPLVKALPGIADERALLEDAHGVSNELIAVPQYPTHTDDYTHDDIATDGEAPHISHHPHSRRVTAESSGARPYVLDNGGRVTSDTHTRVASHRPTADSRRTTGGGAVGVGHAVTTHQRVSTMSTAPVSAGGARVSRHSVSLRGGSGGGAQVGHAGRSAAQSLSHGGAHRDAHSAAVAAAAAGHIHDLSHAHGTAPHPLPPFNLPVTTGASTQPVSHTVIPVTYAVPPARGPAQPMAQFSDGAPQDGGPVSHEYTQQGVYAPHVGGMGGAQGGVGQVTLYAEGRVVGAGGPGGVTGVGGGDVPLWIEHRPGSPDRARQLAEGVTHTAPVSVQQPYGVHGGVHAAQGQGQGVQWGSAAAPVAAWKAAVAAAAASQAAAAQPQYSQDSGNSHMQHHTQAHVHASGQPQGLPVAAAQQQQPVYVLPPHQEAYLPHTHTVMARPADAPVTAQATVPHVTGPQQGTAPQHVPTHHVSVPPGAVPPTATFAHVGPYLEQTHIQESVFEPRFAFAAPPEQPPVNSPRRLGDGAAQQTSSGMGGVGSVYNKGGVAQAAAVPHTVPPWRSPGALPVHNQPVPVTRALAATQARVGQARSPVKQTNRTGLGRDMYDAGVGQRGGTQQASTAGALQRKTGAQAAARGGVGRGTAERTLRTAGTLGLSTRPDSTTARHTGPSQSEDVHGSPASQLVQRAEALHAAVGALAEGLREAVAAASPRRQVVSLPATHSDATATLEAPTTTTQPTQPTQPTTQPTQQAIHTGLVSEGRVTSLSVSSPQKGLTGDVVALRFDSGLAAVAAQQAVQVTGELSQTGAQRTAQGTSSPQRHAGIGATLPTHPALTGVTEQRLTASQPTHAPVPTHTAALKRQRGTADSKGTVTLSHHTHNPSAPTKSSVAVPASKATLTTGGTKAHTRSRLHEDTLSVRTKRVGQGLPGGIANLTALPTSTAKPALAPLNTYTAPAKQGTTPGPAPPATLVAGGLKGGVPAYVESLKPDMTLAAFSAVYGPDRPAGRAAVPVGAAPPTAGDVRAAFQNVSGTGNLTSVVQPGRSSSPVKTAVSPGGSPRPVRFERHDVQPMGQANAGLTVTVRLPEPVRFNLA